MMRDQPQDHYAVLGVPPDAATQQIKSASKIVYLRRHPDKGGRPEEVRKVRQVVNPHVSRFALSQIA
jgi:curved DNA-binding protein CbpA